MRLASRAICSALAIVIAGQIAAPSGAFAERKPAKIKPKRLAERLSESGHGVHFGNLSLSGDTVVKGPLTILEGTLDLASGSRLVGDVWITNGDLIVGDRATVEGKVSIVDGDVFQSRDASITGEIRRYRCSCGLDRDLYRSTGRIAYLDVRDPHALPIEISAGLGSSNRVDYSSVYLGVKRGSPDNRRPHWRGHAHLIAPFRDNTRGYLGVDAELLVPVWGETADLRLRGFKKTATNDGWQYSVEENSWALDFTHTDLLDYYERAGAGLGVVVRPARFWTLDADVYVDQSRSLQVRSAAALFNNGLPYRSNPPVDEGEIMGAVVSAQYDTRQFPSHPQTAWFVTAIVENGLDVGPGDFGFTTFTIDACRYNEIARGLNLDLRAKAFTTWDDLPRQRRQSLNGYGGIRGLHDIPFDVRRGGRLALFSAEVRVDMPPAPILKVLFTWWNLMAFADVGVLRQYGDDPGALGFLKTDWRAWGKSVGVGISGESFVPYIGLYVAQDLDRDNRRPRFIVRLERSF